MINVNVHFCMKRLFVCLCYCLPSSPKYVNMAPSNTCEWKNKQPEWTPETCTVWFGTGTVYRLTLSGISRKSEDSRSSFSNIMQMGTISTA